ncbi:hypothetical protein [Kocuria rosea]|uniref:Uncharacterized protein n=1 Tax=Kocuria rosea TaxID=1275 RepID=A0A4R5YDN9_KOCRO|nr:hypothetical protein [Kocuria rosea]TDL43012.1 hypothetical protein E2R59_09330 [Kocuria rosea]
MVGITFVATPVLVIVAVVTMTEGLARHRWDIIGLGALVVVLALWALSSAHRRWKTHRRTSLSPQPPTAP